MKGGAWLVEHRRPDGGWQACAWGGDGDEPGAPHSRAWGRAAMAAARKQYPRERYRLREYIPAAKTPKARK